MYQTDAEQLFRSLSSENARKINLYIKTGVSSITGNFVLTSCTLSKKEDAIEQGKFVIT